jgi:hypothetical protein
MDYKLFTVKGKAISSKILVPPFLIILISWKIFGALALFMYFMGILTVILFQVWAFLTFFSRDPEVVEAPLRIPPDNSLQNDALG